MSLYASIVVKGVPQALTYSVPESYKEANCGYEVEVDLRNRATRGWLIEILKDNNTLSEAAHKNTLKNSAQQELFAAGIVKRKIDSKDILSAHSAFDPNDLSFFKWIAEYYGSSLSEVFENAVPRQQNYRHVYAVHITDKAKNKEIVSSLLKRAPAQSKLLKIIETQELSSESPELQGPGNKAALAQLIKKELVAKKEVDQEHRIITHIQPTLTQAQETAVEEIRKQVRNESFHTSLLFGITGSGKTEVYIRAIQEALDNNGSALIIVPEIALTPQVLSRFKERFSEPISVLHSKIGAGEKWREWNQILNSKRKIVIGARSAIFAPLQNLKLIIVDEEHESSYKQNDGLRYHARDVAIAKAKYKNCPVLLGSATPSFETLEKARQKKYTLLRLPERATSASLPEMSVVDLKSLKKSEMASKNISMPLRNAIEEALSKKEQIILFYNRRGFASFLQCQTCGTAVECPYCAVTLTFYNKSQKLSCHYCGYAIANPKLCTQCSDSSQVELADPTKKKKIGLLKERGSGTERIVDEVTELFPDANIDRMDREATGGRNSVEEILDKVHSGETDILIGTQMLAKGHDLPKVTLVGLVDADVGLHFPDFRSSERAYQLIVQASGRAGRGELPGKVFIQTREPNHPTLVAAVSGRFTAFARYEMDFRKKLGYPPIARLARVVISSEDKLLCEVSSRELSRYLQEAASNNEAVEKIGLWKVLGPSKAPIEKIKKMHRWHMLLKSESPKTLSMLSSLIKTWVNTQEIDKKLKVIVDIDPTEML